MSDVPHRFEHVRRSARIGRFLAVVGIGGLAVVAAFMLAGDSSPWPWFVANVLPLSLVFGLFVAAALFVFLWNLVAVILKVEGNSFRSYGVLRDLLASMEEEQHHLKAISENGQLSDVVRAVTHRGRERTALRLAINEEIIRGDWEAAYALVELLESRHGYRNEAARLREEVDQSRGRQGREKLHEAVEQVNRLMESHDWDRARRMMDHLVAQHPDNDEVRALPARFGQLRNEHKRRLLKQWDESVLRNEVDRGIAILKELDQYLTPNEAAALQESARGVFRAKLHNLGVQFSLAVSSQKWGEAYKIGQEIVREFPNSRMAAEVKDRSHVLAERAAESSGEPATVKVAQD